MDCHLVAVEVGVECGTGQRVQLDGTAFHQYLKETLAIILSFDTNVLVQYLESLELFLLSPSIKYESAGTTYAHTLSAPGQQMPCAVLFPL